MITISITTIIAGAVVVLLAILGSLINPFLRSLRFPETEGNEAESTQEGNEAESSQEGNQAELSQKENAEPVTILITAHDNLPELERNLPMFLNQQYAADYQVIVVSQSTDVRYHGLPEAYGCQNPHLYYTYIPEEFTLHEPQEVADYFGCESSQIRVDYSDRTNLQTGKQPMACTLWPSNVSTSNHLVLGYVSF